MNVYMLNQVCYRRAEMRLKEVQAEAAQLRNKLTTLETCDESQEDKSKSRYLFT